MKTALDCVPCLLRQALEAARFVSDDPASHRRVVRRVLAELSEFDLSEPPPVAAAGIHRLVREIAGVSDPYEETKRRFTARALEMLPELRERVRRSDDPFAAAVRFAVAGNIVDLGVNGGLTHDDVDRALSRAMAAPLDEAALAELRQAAARVRDGAGTILYLADNAGEIVFDRLLLEQLAGARLKVAVKGGAVINDATRRDAEQAGIGEIAEIIDTGSDTPGVVLEETGDGFREEFGRAGLVIAKGQGNYEALSEAPREVFFLLMVKCDVLASDLAEPGGTLYLGRKEE
jgi:hypothetical protein